MQAIFTARAAICSVALLVLGSCGEMEGGGSSFRDQYIVARNALEEGHFAKANRTYERLLPAAGPLSDRIGLEYAHSQLRSGDYAGAASRARGIVASTTGAARAAALAVEGTAEHEIGLELLTAGKPSDARAHLARAHSALSEALANTAEVDPLGALAGRKSSIERQLGAL